MSITRSRPKSRKWETKARCSDSGGYYIERNRFGELYFRRPHGDDGFITLHITPPGGRLLRDRGLRVGMCLPHSLYKELYEGDYLYTEG